MQTYTHLLLGTAMGKTLFHDEPMVNIVMIMAGSVLPDFVAIAKYVIDRMRGAPPLAKQGRKLLLIQEISNSIFLWGLGLVVTLYFSSNQFVTLLIASYVTHLIIDRLTHGGKEYMETDPSFMWPLPGKVLRGFGVLEYRYGHAVLWPVKWWEGIVNMVAILLIILI